MSWLAFLVTFLQGALPCVIGSVSVQDSRSRPPLDSELKRGIKKVRLVYADDYQKIESLAADVKKQRNVKYLLSRKLLEDVQRLEPSESVFFPIVTEVIRLSIDAHRPKTGLAAIRVLERHYSVDSSKLRLNVFGKSITNETSLHEIKAATEELKHSIQVAVFERQMEAAQQIAALGNKLALQVRSKNLKTEISKASKTLRDLTKQDLAFEKSQQKVKDKTASQDDYVFVAFYLGLRNGDWNEAEIISRQIKDESIRELFINEALNDNTLESVIKLCKAWSNFKNEKAPLFESQAQELVAYRLSLVIDRLDGFEKKLAVSKIKEVIQNPILVRNWGLSEYGRLASLGFTWNVAEKGNMSKTVGKPKKAISNAKNVFAAVGQLKKFQVGAAVFVDDTNIRWKSIPKPFQNATYVSAQKHIGKNRIQVKDDGKVFLLIHDSWGGGGSGGPWQKELITEKEFSKQGWKKTESVFVYGKTPDHSEKFEVWSKACKQNEVIDIRTHKYIAPIVAFRSDK